MKWGGACGGGLASWCRSDPGLQDAYHAHGDESVVDFGADVDGPCGVGGGFFCGGDFVTPSVAKSEMGGLGMVRDDKVRLGGGGVGEAVDESPVAFQGGDVLEGEDGSGLVIFDGE